MLNYLFIGATILVLLALKLTKFVVIALVIGLLVIMITYNLKKKGDKR
ncbi:MAG: hypothetical protein N2738_09795 [Thermodesulfovibrionales bacterium]|nr:hypothetical protein [Thermodesulfovibrionales bacterium]